MGATEAPLQRDRRRWPRSPRPRPTPAPTPSRNGFLTLLSDGERLTGAYALGPEAGEWLQQATLAIRARVPLDVLRDTIQPFPTFSEIYLDALKALRAEIAAGASRPRRCAGVSALDGRAGPAVTPGGPSAGRGRAAGADALRSAAGAALIAATVLASMVGFLDAYVVNVAVPAIGRDLDASVASLQWSPDGLPADGRRRCCWCRGAGRPLRAPAILMVGLCVMLVASVLCALAPSSGA